MKSKMMKMAAVTGAVLLTMFGLAGCGNGGEPGNAGTSSSAVESSVRDNNTAAADAQEESISVQGADTNISGTILMVGSTSMEKLANALAESFMEEYPGVTVNAEFVGSSAGVEAVNNGTADIGNSSRNLKDEEKEAGAVENIVAIDGIAVCVDSANTVTGLTRQQLTDIYTGAITDWNEVGGSDGPIIVVGREAGSGTRGAFEEILGVEDTCVYANELDSTGAVMAKVASTPGAIGYVSLDAVDDSVAALALEGVEATAENIKAGDYFLSRPFVMATKGEISAQSELVQAWFDYVLGEEGQRVAQAVGLIPIN